MALLRRKGFWESGRVQYLPVDAIAPNPDQPRRVFSPHELRSWPSPFRSWASSSP